jgi:hypothetical protein
MSELKSKDNASYTGYLTFFKNKDGESLGLATTQDVEETIKRVMDGVLRPLNVMSSSREANSLSIAIQRGISQIRRVTVESDLKENEKNQAVDDASTIRLK